MSSRDGKALWALSGLAFVTVGGLVTAAVVGFTSASRPASADITLLEYVAIGDSYVSGVGAEDYIGADQCYRSYNAYPQLVADEIGEKLWFDACSGATTGDVLKTQLDHLDKSTSHVTIGVGGNDVGFAPVLTACAGTDSGACTIAVDESKDEITDTLPARLEEVYTEVEDRAPNATVVVVGNPRLFDGTTCEGSLGITAEEQMALNESADLLAETTAEVAGEYGFQFADVRDAFADHAVCSEDPWLLGYIQDEVGVFHPNAAGQAGYADVVLNYPYQS